MSDAGRPPADRGATQGDETSVRADLVLRIAWLRVHGQLMFAVDPTGQTSAQLWDFADLLEALDAEGRWPE